MTNVTLYDNVAGAGGSGAGSEPAGAPGMGGGVFGDGHGGIDGRCHRRRTTRRLRAPPIYANDATEAASIIANNGGTDPCDGAGGGPVDQGRDDNIAYPSGSLCPGIVANPDLGPLQSNGGPVETMALLAGSPAIQIVPTGPLCPQTDARGVTRPQLFACDAGAYEWAPPVLSDTSAAATSATTAQVDATVEPNLQQTTVVVDYGTTITYSSRTMPASAGSENSPVPISVPLTGLTPNTTYQAEVVATNADGTTSSQNLSFTTPSSPSAAPTLTGLDESARSWYLGTAAARISASRRPVGTTFSLTLNETATVTFTFSQHGCRVGRCPAAASSRASQTGTNRAASAWATVRRSVSPATPASTMCTSTV